MTTDVERFKREHPWHLRWAGVKLRVHLFLARYLHKEAQAPEEQTQEAGGKLPVPVRKQVSSEKLDELVEMIRRS